MKAQFISFFNCPVFLYVMLVFFSPLAISNEECLSNFDNSTQNTSTKEQNISTQPELLSLHINHSLLKPETSLNQVKQLAEEASTYKMNAICVNSCRVVDVKSYLSNRRKNDPHKPKIISTINFPLGASPIELKKQEGDQAYLDGAKELDIMTNIGAIKDGNWDFIKKEVRHLRFNQNNHPVTITIETDLLTAKEIIEVAKVIAEGGASFIKTSSGFIPYGKGVTLENIELIKEGIEQANINFDIKTEITASGEITNLDQALEFLKAGATRLETRHSLSIVKSAMEKHNIIPPRVSVEY